MLNIFDHIDEIKNEFKLETIVELMFLGKAKFSKAGYVICHGYGDKDILSADVNPGMSIIGTERELKIIHSRTHCSLDELSKELDNLKSIYLDDKREYKKCLKTLLHEYYNTNISFKTKVNDIFMDTVIDYMNLTKGLKNFSYVMSDGFREKVKTFLNNNPDYIYDLYYRKDSIWNYSNSSICHCLNSKDSLVYHEYKTPEEAISFLERVNERDEKNKHEHDKVNDILIDWFKYYKYDKSDIDITITQC